MPATVPTGVTNAWTSRLHTHLRLLSRVVRYLRRKIHNLLQQDESEEDEREWEPRSSVVVTSEHDRSVTTPGNLIGNFLSEWVEVRVSTLSPHI